jgi:hypothetical protein
MIRHATRKVAHKVKHHHKPGLGTVGKAAAFLAGPFPDAELLVASMANPGSGIKFIIGITKRAGNRVSEVQSVIFDKLKWTADAAKQWLKDHNFAGSGKDEGDTFYRFRQQSPKRYKEFRTIVPGVRNPQRYMHTAGYKPAPARDWKSESRSIEVTNGAEIIRLDVYADGRHAISMPDQEPFRKSGPVWLDATDAEWTPVVGGRRHNPANYGRVHGRLQLSDRPVVLTTDHAQSSYEIPVLLMGGRVYGPGDNNYPLWVKTYPGTVLEGQRPFDPKAQFEDYFGEYDTEHRREQAAADAMAGSWNDAVTRAWDQRKGTPQEWKGVMPNPAPDVADAITSYDEHLGMTTRPEFQGASPDEQAAAMTAMDLAENPSNEVFHHSPVIAQAHQSDTHFLRYEADQPDSRSRFDAARRVLDSHQVAYSAWRVPGYAGFPGYYSVQYLAKDLPVLESAGLVGTSHMPWEENPIGGLGQAAFDAAKEFRLSGAYSETGVANARVAKYGFTKWYNNLLPQTAKGHRKSTLLKAWMEGWAAGKRVEKRGNPESSASALYEDFHGRPPGKIKEVVTEVQEHEWLTQLGTLTELKVATLTNLDATLAFEGKGTPDLCSSEEGHQLHIEGGDQSLDLKALKMDGDKWYKESMVIGVLYELTYQTEKSFHKFRPTGYFHKLGEETGAQPFLLYDPVNKLLSVSGGQYEIKPEGIVN